MRSSFSSTGTANLAPFRAMASSMPPTTRGWDLCYEGCRSGPRAPPPHHTPLVRHSNRVSWQRDRCCRRILRPIVRRSLTAAVLSGLLLLSAALPAYAALDASDPAQPPASATPPAKAALGPLEFISQTMNNCGPASVAEVLDFWGIHKSQGEVQAVLRADGNPNGMSPFGLPSYVRGLGMAALMG